ncbi:ubiquinol-cytochrome C chaperone family protein [Jiella avicenniae]|uniref:Ubiquinol-cytochrome c chaperone domain-containing protein n=1 Tax=Jiella avicenniae TaxID=2907202 RepID=A0A9X1T523_9HYPH|nr:ubiquinol-cytochrome C chaperone family protein [Jiella avicenniae]MCE7027760.1 hypothetical protein [Jiella avicenniae]MCE7028802.1 hypothetical protein [Jiella avicenniae]
MFHRWRIARRNRAIVEDLYQSLVAETRQPKLYEHCGIADTFSGRFEALAIHVFLFLRRCRGEARLEPVAQEVVDRFVTDVDTSIRELGVGDQSVPKRMRKLAGVFYERVRVYDAAFAAADPAAALAAALKGRAVGDDADAAAVLATYMQETADRLEAVSADDILSGTLSFGA